MYCILYVSCAASACLSLLVYSVGTVILTIDLSYLPNPSTRQDMTQDQILSGVLQVWIQSFPSPRLVASPRLKNLVCPTIYL